MNTLYLSAEDPKTPAIAANIIMQGGLVAIPTETVYGLGANGLDEAAVARIFEAKGRPQDNPLILHICDPEQMALFCRDIPDAAYDLARPAYHCASRPGLRAQTHHRRTFHCGCPLPG